MRKLLCFLLGAVVATFALPGVAGNDKKMYGLDVEIVSQPPAQPPFTITATITSEGNSTINSFQLFVAGMTIVGVDQPATGTPKISPDGSSVSVTNMHPLKGSLTVTLYVNSCGDGQWGAAVWTGSQLNGQSFNLDSANSNLVTSMACGELGAGVNDFVVPDSVNTGCVTVSRGFYDKDGSNPGGTLPIFVTNTILSNNQLNFRWPDFQGVVHDPLATFEYTICAPGPLPEVANTQVAWLNTNGHPASEPGTPAFIQAQECIDPKRLPAPYGTLVGSGVVLPGPADAGYLPSTTITVDALSPLGPDDPNGTIPHSVPPFDIVIGTERLTVTDVVSDDGPGGDLSDPDDADEAAGAEEGSEQETWTVTRAVLGTTAAAHSGGVLVMSTPLPPITVALPPGSPYTAGTQALMCIADRFSEGSGHATTIIDIGGDGGVKLP
jgi:hypothetical protein